MNPFLGLTIVLGALGLLIGVVKFLRAARWVGSEASRKLVHVGMGVVCLMFPLLFKEPWPVWVLAFAACGVLVALRTVPYLKREFGSVLHGVDRISWGELYFPVGVAAVFTLAHPDHIRYLIPISVLTFADAAGALIGKRFGRMKYVTLEGTKSVEGSLAVGMVGFLCAFAPTYVCGYGLTSCVLIGVLVGLFCLLVEAISWRGLDNIFLPLAAYAQITVYLNLAQGQLINRMVALIAITVIALAWRRGSLADDSARFGAALALYFFWSTANWTWLVAPVILLASYVRLMPAVPGGVPCHNLVAVICVSSAGLLWCVANAFAPNQHWLWPFTLALAAQQAVIGIVRFSQAHPTWSRPMLWASGTIPAIALHEVAFWAVNRPLDVVPLDYTIGAVCVALAGASFVLWERNLQKPLDLNERWWKQGAIAIGASTLAFSLLQT